MDDPKVNNWSLKKANKTVIVLEIVKVWIIYNTEIILKTLRGGDLTIMYLLLGFKFRSKKSVYCTTYGQFCFV